MPSPTMPGPMATQDSAVGLNRAWSSLSTFISNELLHPEAFVEGTKNFFHGAHDALHIFASSLVRTHPASGITATELADLESGINVPELPNTSHEPEDDPFVDAEDSEDLRQTTMGEQQGPMEALSSHSYRAFMWMAARFVGPLSLIVVPGLVLGVVTGQLPWGIALCGAIATVLSFFVGLNKTETP